MDGGGGEGGVEVGSRNDKKWWLSKMVTRRKINEINSGLNLTTNQSGEVDDVRSNTEYNYQSTL